MVSHLVQGAPLIRVLVGPVVLLRRIVSYLRVLLGPVLLGSVVLVVPPVWPWTTQATSSSARGPGAPRPPRFCPLPDRGRRRRRRGVYPWDRNVVMGHKRCGPERYLAPGLYAYLGNSVRIGVLGSQHARLIPVAQARPPPPLLHPPRRLMILAGS